MMSEALERFRYSFFEDPYSARGGLDIAAAEALSGEDRVKAEKMLLDFLPDTRAVIGLGALHSQRAMLVLRRMFGQIPRGDFSGHSIEIAKALNAIAPNEDCIAFLAAVIRLPFGWTQRMDAAIALGQVRDAVAVDALIFALDDKDELVRHHAACGLLALHGLMIDANDLENCTLRIMSQDSERRESGKRDVLAAIAGRPLAKPG